MLTPTVRAETAAPGLAYRHPDAILIGRAVEVGELEVLDLDSEERKATRDLAERIGGLGSGEVETLAVAVARQVPVVLHDRQAEAVARSLGLEPVHPLEVLWRGTPSVSLLRNRIRAFAALVDMRVADVDALLELAEGMWM